MSREEEWRLVGTLTPEEGTTLMEHMTRSYHASIEEQQGQSATSKALSHSEKSADISATRQHALDAHDRLMMRRAAESARDVLHDNGPGKEPGIYTTHEARDRAGHAAPAYAREPEK